MWGCLVRMTKEKRRGWQWPSPEATRSMLVTPSLGLGACVDVVCTAAVCVGTQQLRVFLLPLWPVPLPPLEVGGGSSCLGGW